MTKLEEKLIELGYRKIVLPTFIRYFKFYVYDVEIIIDLEYERILYYMVLCTSAIKTQQHIEDLQQAYNIMKKDLEELRKYEKE